MKGSFVEPPEEAKIFVGNLSYDIDSEKLAMLFERAGTVEIAEVSLFGGFFVKFAEFIFKFSSWLLVRLFILFF